MKLKKFSEIIGQKQAVSLLKRAIERDRLSHAYLFYGMRGVGKETLAYTLSGALLCKSSEKDRPCKTCVACKKLSKDIHPDFMLLYPEKKEITISQIRRISEFIKYRPIEAPYQIVLIKEAEKMNQEAANALLKSLEEPPSYTIFILITQNLSQLLPTIISRCQPVRFNPIAPGLIKEYLKKNYGFEEKVAETLADISQGSIGIALDIAEKGLLEELNAFVKASYEKSWKVKFKVVERLGRLNPQEQELFFYLLMLWIWRSYQKRTLQKPYPPAFPEEIFSGDPYKLIPKIFQIKYNLRFYISTELTFLNLLFMLTFQV